MNCLSSGVGRLLFVVCVVAVGGCLLCAGCLPFVVRLLLCVVAIC